MMPNITRGGRTAGVTVYLVGPGRHNEHVNPHVVAGHDTLVSELPEGRLSSDDALDAANLLDHPMRVFGTKVSAPVKQWSDEAQAQVQVGTKPAHVWHCSLSLRADEGQIGDEVWSRVVTEFVDEMGFSGTSERAACRWLAVHHGRSTAGNDHVHIVVNLVREDGTKARVHNDAARAQRAANLLERRHGLRVLESRESGRGAAVGVKPAELARAQRETALAPARDELRRRVRAVAAEAGSERELVDGLRDARVLVRPRYAEGDRQRVVGYSVALVSLERDGRRAAPVWYGAGRLDRTLSLGQLRTRWGQDPAGAEDVAGLWTRRWAGGDVATTVRTTGAPVRAGRVLGGYRDRSSAAEDRAAAGAAAAALARASLAIEKDRPGPLAAASEVLARAAQPVAFGADRDQHKQESSAANAAYSLRLMGRGTGRDSRTGWLAVLRQADRTAKAVAAAQRAQGRVQAAAATDASMHAAMRSVSQLAGAGRARIEPSQTDLLTGRGKGPRADGDLERG
ncbi:relaxase/mobilization nuclease domain-containing protein [Aquipuribacter hungaricus]|uniref:relaxase/mobilization nuclease domain-containing protein n=1 Tax=Aquipuribacter hungaricus TaxID=545624 RepID=UPI0030ED0186